MEPKNTSGRLHIAKIVAALALVAAATGAAFGAWIDNGPQILMSMAATGMSWCF